MKYSLLPVTLLVFFGAACSSSEFASSASTNKKKSQSQGKDTGDPNDSNNPDFVDLDGDGINDNLANNDTDAQSGMNPDGTLTEKFVGSLTKLEGGSDIVFAVDTSGSMKTEKTMLEQNMTAFLNKFSQENAKLDYQVYLIGEGFQFPQNLGDKFIPVPRKVNSNDALEILQGFFNGTIAQPKPVRLDTKKQIVVVTDDDARRVTSPAFKTFVDATPALKDKTSMNGFVILPDSKLNSWCTKAAVGSEYITLAADAATKGTIYDLCTTDWGVLLKGLAEKILREAPKERFALNSVPEKSSEISVLVNGKDVDPSDWSYDKKANTIAFTAETVPEEGDSVAVTFRPIEE